MKVVGTVTARDDGVPEADAVVPRLQTIACPCGQPVAFWTNPQGLGTDPPGATVIVFSFAKRTVGFGFCQDDHLPGREQRRQLVGRARRSKTPALGTIKVEPAGTVRTGRVS